MDSSTKNASWPNAVKASLERIVRATILWGITSTILGATLTLLAADWVTLGPQFKYAIWGAWALALVAGAPITTLLIRNVERNQQAPKKWPLSKRKTAAVILASVTAIAAATVLTGIISREMQESRNTRKADTARERFVVNLHLGGNAEFDAEAINQTLAELEDSYQSLKDNWELPQEASKITAHLLPDLQTYQATLGNEYAAGHASCLTEQGPVIVIPLEKAPSASTSDNFSQTPKHEMVHALMCQSLGENSFYSIPRWFLEGMAERYETDGIARIRMRVEPRLRLWLSKQEPMQPNRFCAKTFTQRDEADQRAFYDTSREFVRFLESRHDVEHLNLIVDDVRTGMTFDTSMQRRLGGTCEELYDVWKNTF